MNTTDPGTLILFSGKMGAGKSTMSAEVALERGAVLLSEDVWLAQLYPNQIKNFEDYIAYSRRIRGVVAELVASILRCGTDVVMDFPANTVSQRQWFKALCQESGCSHELIYLEAADEVCLRHLSTRCIEHPERAAFDTEEVFAQVTAYFEPVADNEGFNVRTIQVDR